MAVTDPIFATFVNSTTLTATVDNDGNTDLRDQCAVGVKIKADCGVDGYKYGVVSSVSYSAPTTTIQITGDALTANLVSFWHGNDNRLSLVNHGHTSVSDGGVVAKSSVGLGNCDNTSDASKPVSTAQQTALDGKVSHSLATAANDVLVASGVGVFVKKTLAELKTILGLMSAAFASIGIDPEQLVRAGDLGTAAGLDQTWLYASATWDAGSCANAAQVSTTVAVPAAAIGDKVFPSASIALSGLHLRGEVTATDVVTLYLSNLTGSAVDLASATYYVAILKRTPAR